MCSSSKMRSVVVCESFGGITEQSRIEWFDTYTSNRLNNRDRKWFIASSSTFSNGPTNDGQFERADIIKFRIDTYAQSTYELVGTMDRPSCWPYQEMPFRSFVWFNIWPPAMLNCLTTSSGQSAITTIRYPCDTADRVRKARSPKK